MTLLEVLPVVQQLSSVDKKHLIDGLQRLVLAEEFARQYEGVDEIEMWSPIEVSGEALAILEGLIAKEDAK
jgi:hypothetical protein